MLAGFFLASHVIHGSVQFWWIAPVLLSLNAVQLMLGATVLTAFCDNAVIKLLATLVPGFTDEFKYAVVAGAATVGGLAVIASAPDPAGQSILKPHFANAVSPVGLVKASLVPTIICWLCASLRRIAFGTCKRASILGSMLPFAATCTYVCNADQAVIYNIGRNVCSAFSPEGGQWPCPSQPKPVSACSARCQRSALHHNFLLLDVWMRRPSWKKGFLLQQVFS